MSYKPWPEEGCTLAEARERTVDRALWREWSDLHYDYRSLGSPPEWGSEVRRDVIHANKDRRKQFETKIQSIESDINRQFISFLSKRRLVAYGRRKDLSSGPQLIDPDVWSSLSDITWNSSSAGKTRAQGTTFVAIRIFPALKSPSQLDLLSGKTLADAFREFILNDPEVAALAKISIEDAPEFERVFVQGHCFVRGCKEWPLEKGCGITGVVHQDQARRTGVGCLAEPDPQSASDAADALTDRFDTLFDLLRDGKLIARAIRVDNGNQESILPSIWSHHDFWLDAREGNILQVNPDCKEPPRDLLRRRWVGVLLVRDNAENRLIAPSFHSELASPRHRLEAPFAPDDVVAAGSFGAALERLVLHHPIVEKLRSAARMASQRDLCPLYEDAGLFTPCYGHDEPLLPIRIAAKEKFDSLLTEDDLTDISPELRPLISSEISQLYQTISLHICWLFEHLRQQRVLVFAHTIQGDRIPINHTIWSHDAYYILPRTGDIFEALPGRMTRRWVGATFEQVAAVSQPASTQAVRLPAQPKSIERVVTKTLAVRECIKWLTGEMEKSPDQRTSTKDEFWEGAINRWPARLSRRSFDGAWAEAIRQTGAARWAAAGAPKKTKKNPRTNNPRTK